MSEQKRKVVVYKWVREGLYGPCHKETIGLGYFLAFGVDTGVGTYSTAIVEMLDGTVKNVPVDMIVFNN